MSGDHHSHAHSNAEEEFSQSVVEVAHAEEHAKKLSESAQQERAEIILNGRKKSSEITQKAAEDAEKAHEKTIAAERAGIEKENDAVIAHAKAKASEIKKMPFKQLAATLAKEILPKH